LQAGLALGPEGAPVLDPVLEIADSVMTYRRRYFAQPQWPAVLDLLLSDDTNPRSLAFQIVALADHTANLPRVARDPSAGHPARQAVALRELVLRPDGFLLNEEHHGPGQPGTPAGPFLKQLMVGLRRMSDTISHLYFSHVETRVS